MKLQTICVEKKCPKCGRTENQVYYGYNDSGTRGCKCKECNIKYTINPKTREYPEETKRLAMKLLVSGMSSNAIGHVLEMNHQNAHRWAKKRASEK